MFIFCRPLSFHLLASPKPITPDVIRLFRLPWESVRSIRNDPRCCCLLSFPSGMTSSRSATAPWRTPTSWADTAATSPRRRSSPRDPPSRSDSCRTTPTRGRASLCATRSSKQVGMNETKVLELEVLAR